MIEQEARTTPSQRGLGFLLASTGVAITGQGMATAAAPLLAADLTRNPLAVSAVTAASYAAWLIIGLPAGALVDRWPHKPVLVATDLGRAAIVALLAIAVLTGHASVPALIATVFLIGVGSCFFDPAAQATIPALTGRNRQALTKANGKLWALDTFGRSLAGPPLGAAAFGLAAGFPFGAQAAAFLASSALLLGLPRTSQRSERTPVLKSIGAGLRFMIKNAELRLLTAGMATYNLAYNIAFAPLVLFAQDQLNIGNLGFGLLIATMAMGGIAGGWIAPKISRRIRALPIYALALTTQGIGWLLVVTTANVWATGAALALVGLASTTVSVVGGAARQLLTPDDMLGRMTSVTRIFGIGAAAVGAMIGGAVASAWGNSAPFVATILLLGVAAATFALAGRSTGTGATQV